MHGHQNDYRVQRENQTKQVFDRINKKIKERELFKAERKRMKEVYAHRDEMRKVQAKIDKNRETNKVGLDQVPHVLQEVELITQERKVERAKHDEDEGIRHRTPPRDLEGLE